jgi:hypothetical protein
MYLLGGGAKFQLKCYRACAGQRELPVSDYASDVTMSSLKNM